MPDKINNTTSDPYDVTIVPETGKDIKYKSQDPNFGEKPSTHSTIDEPGYPQPQNTPPPREIPKRVAPETREIWSINTHKGEKPTEVVGTSIKKEPDDLKLKEAMDMYRRPTRELDNLDQTGRKQNDASVYRMAELKKIDNYIKEQKQRIEKSKNLTKEEVDILVNHYRKTLIKQHQEDVAARMDISKEKRRLDEIENYKKTHDIDKEKKEINNFTDVLPISELTPEPTPETIDLRKERNVKRALLIAGVVAGGTTGLLGGAGVAGPALLACSATGVLNYGLGKLGTWRMKVLTEKINLAQGEKKEKLMNRMKNWMKIVKGTEYVNKFIRGFGYGALGSYLISNVFMGGKGLVEIIRGAQPSTTVPGEPSMSTESRNYLKDSGEVQKNISPNPLKQSQPGTESSSEILVQDGRVNLPGSSWDGNLGRGPAQDILQGGPLNQSNYTGGIHEMAPNVLEGLLQRAGVSRETLTSTLGTKGTHQLLNTTLETIRAGNPNPDLITMLQSMGTNTGASELLQTLTP